MDSRRRLMHKGCRLNEWHNKRPRTRAAQAGEQASARAVRLGRVRQGPPQASSSFFLLTARLVRPAAACPLKRRFLEGHDGLPTRLARWPDGGLDHHRPGPARSCCASALALDIHHSPLRLERLQLRMPLTLSVSRAPSIRHLDGDQQRQEHRRSGGRRAQKRSAARGRRAGARCKRMPQFGYPWRMRKSSIKEGLYSARTCAKSMEVVPSAGQGRVVWAWIVSGGQTLAAGAEYVASDWQIRRVCAPPPLGWPAFAAAAQASLRACRGLKSEFVCSAGPLDARHCPQACLARMGARMVARIAP